MNTQDLFMASALEIHRRAPHPAAHAVLLGIFLAVFSLLGWAALSEVDVVAVAPGTVIPQARSKPVQSQADGVVKQLWVAEGDRVAAGARLMMLDPQSVRSGLNRAVDLYRNRRNDALLSEAYGCALNAKRLARTAPGVLARRCLDPLLASADQQYAIELGERLATRIAAYRHELASRHAQHAALEREIRALDARIRFMDFDLPAAAESLSSYRALAARQLVAQERLVRAEREHAERVHRHEELLAEREGLLESQSRLESALNAFIERERSDVSDAAIRHRADSEDARWQMQQHREQLARMTIHAPVAGTVQQLAVRGPGAVVATGDVLMVIVPEGAVLEIEASIANRDIGFVHEAQHAAVKVDAFRFTRYGLAAGRVRTVSAEAVESGNGERRYPARIALDAPALSVGEQQYPLEPGMHVSVEIRTGTRSVLDYFLSPLKATTHQSIRER